MRRFQVGVGNDFYDWSCEHLTIVECNKGPKGYHSCKRCFYSRKKYDKRKDWCGDLYECRARFRKDGKSVYFVKVEERVL